MEPHRQLRPRPGKDLSRGLRGGVFGPGHDLGLDLGPPQLVDIGLGRVEDLMDQQIHILSVVHRQRRGFTIPRIHHRQTGIVQPVPHRPIDPVRDRKRRDRHPVGVIHHLGRIRGELVRLQIKPTRIQIPQLGAVMPTGEPVDAVHQRLNPQLGGLPRRTMNMHRLQTPIRLPKVVIHRQIRHMIQVEMRDEELVGLVIRHPQRIERQIRPRPRIKHEHVAVPQLHQKPGTPLRPTRRIPRPQRRHPNLIRRQHLTTRRHLRRILHQRRPRILHHHPIRRQRHPRIRLRQLLRHGCSSRSGRPSTSDGSAPGESVSRSRRT